MLAALLYSTAGLALTGVGALGLMATVAFSSIFFAVIGGDPALGIHAARDGPDRTLNN